MGDRYTRTEWVDGAAPGLSHINLNKIELGIERTHARYMTENERDALAGDDLFAGRIIYNTDEDRAEEYTGTAWQPIGFIEALEKIASDVRTTPGGTEAEALAVTNADGRVGAASFADSAPVRLIIEGFMCVGGTAEEDASGLSYVRYGSGYIQVYASNEEAKCTTALYLGSSINNVDPGGEDYPEILVDNFTEAVIDWSNSQEAGGEARFYVGGSMVGGGAFTRREQTINLSSATGGKVIYVEARDNSDNSATETNIHIYNITLR